MERDFNKEKEFEKTKQKNKSNPNADNDINSFKLKQNHIKLLKENETGKIILKNLKKNNQTLSHFQKERANKIIDGMVRNLANHGYLVKEERGVYKLSSLAYDALAKGIEMEINKVKQRVFKATDGLKITYFDKCFLEVVGEDNKIDPYYLSQHPKAEAIKKRKINLEKAGFINENTLSSELLERLNLTEIRQKQKNISLEMLTKKQVEVLNDMSIFLNLTPRQIEEHIYMGNKQLMACDLRYLIEKKVLKKVIDFDVYVLDTQGIRLYTKMNLPNSVRYKTKVAGKTSELKHDILIYDAFKNLEEELEEENKEVVLVKNDRQLRREDAQIYGHMQGDYPDLRVFYRERNVDNENNLLTNELAIDNLKYKDIEIDVGYDEKTIAEKLAGFFAGEAGYYSSAGSNSNQAFNVNVETNLVKEIGWYCNSTKQALKVARAFQKLDAKAKSNNRVKKLIISVINPDGSVSKKLW